MKTKRLKRFSKVVTAFVAINLMVQGFAALFTDIVHMAVHATEGNVVAFKQTTVEASTTNLVYVDVVARGRTGDTIIVAYKTYGETAIQDIDYVGIESTVTFKIKDSTVEESYRIAIKCKNDSSNREKFRVYDQNQTYGRYFNLKITSVNNATIEEGKGVCKCYLTYENKVEATVGIRDDYFGREIAYLNEYKTMLSQYEGGTGSLDGGSTRKTWEKGVSFNNETTRKWLATYISTGFADAYGSFVIKTIDDGTWSHDGSVSILAGNRQFIQNYSRSADAPGLYVYAKIDPPGERLNGKAMKYISQWINPYKKDDDLVDAKNIRYVAPAEDHEQIYWIQEKDAWFASKGSIYDSEFYKIREYNGILDQGLAAYNHNDEADMKVKDIWMFMTLYDNKAPVIVGQYADYNPENGALRIYLRFNEPVYSSKNGELTVKINNYSTNFDAKLVKTSNYSDTLIYEVKHEDVPKSKIVSVKYTLYPDDVGDMSYKLDYYKHVNNNKVQNADQLRTTTIIGNEIDLAKPKLNVDIQSSQYKANNIYNIVLSANDNGEREFNDGTVYYSWSASEDLPGDKNLPTSYDYSHVLTSEERGSFTVSLAKNENYDSGLYYLHALAVSKYGFTDANTFGPYLLDGDAPTISSFSFDQNDLKTKIYSLQLVKKRTGSNIKTVVLNATYQAALGSEKTAKLTIVENGVPAEGLSSLVNITSEEVDENRIVTIKYKSNIDEATASTIPLDTFIKGLMGEGNRLPVAISFQVEDEAGNRAKSNEYRVNYDIRDTFTPEITIPTSYQPLVDPSIDISHEVYNIHGASVEDGITYSITDDTIRGYIDAGAKLSVTINDAETRVADGYSITLKGLKAGYYSFMARVAGKMSGDEEIDLISNVTAYSLTDNMEDNTYNKQTVNGNLVLTNRVYQLEDARFYYYNTASSAVLNHLYGATYNPSTGRYDGGSAIPTFSSSIEAKKYVKYMEYQDLYLLSISDTIASLLNSGTGSTTYVKAANETKNAQSGQLWIRYKKSSWTTNTGSSGWAWYYYSDGVIDDGVNINALSPNLTGAIETVVNRIISDGKDKYLVEEGDLNQKTGAPYLADSQIHVNPEAASVSRSGTTFVTDATYAGDASIYQNNILYGNNSYPLATNMVLRVSGSTSLYYKYLENDSWTPLNAKDGMLLSEALRGMSAGVYTIREYGDAGVSEFAVYFDNELPKLNTTKDKGIPGSEVDDFVLDGGVTSITCKNLNLKGILNEDDPYAYVAVYSYPNKSLQTVLYGNDIQDYLLANGNFYLQVGDRSGNVVTYTVLTSETNIDLTVEENESKSGVYVKVSNRDESEIYSYEVYLNESLIDSEFATSKFYRDSGIYRVEVIDIYGNKETKTITHESPSPDITWYYLNDSGGYSVYNEQKISRMYLVDDPYSPRTTNIYSSTLVRLLFNNLLSNSDVKFELTGLEEKDYTFNNTTGLLSINSLSNWKLRVWYADQPENDHIYNFILDNKAPEISGTFIGLSYHYHVEYDEQGNVTCTSTFDAINYNNYEVDDTITLDTLAYEKDGTSTLTFESGHIISGTHIVIHVSDPTGIRSYTITRNGQPLDMKLNTDNKLLINSYGTYVLTFTDNLGNVSTFIFTNLEGDISSTTIDGELIEQDIMNYGHDDITMNTFYDGTNTILVTTNDSKETYLFTSDGKTITYGQYVVREDENQEQSEESHEGKYADFDTNEDFVLEIDDSVIRFNAWYTAVATADYEIQVMVDSSKHVNYRVVCKQNYVGVEMSFSTNKEHLPNRFVAILSKEMPNITLLTGDEAVERKEELEYIYVAEDLTIDTTSVTANISSIEFNYSESPNPGENITIYKDGEFVLDFVGHEDGFYQIIVTNVYNNQVIYKVNKIVSFVSVVNIHTLDGSTVTFLNNDGNTIYASASIELVIYSDNVYFIVNNLSTSGYYENGRTILELTKEGNYDVRVVGDNGIHEDFNFEIGSDESFLFEEDWVTGYNEQALLRDQGYTNQPLSINLGEDVVFVDMVVNDENHVVLYDNITEDRRTDLEPLHEAVGRYGNGKYAIGFRNKYGDLVIKTVYFNNTPSLYLDRVTTSNPSVYEPYDLDFALTHDFYSNYVLRFSTSSINYVFTINGEEYRLDEPKTIEFTNASGNGSFSYEITYLDEYGNFVKFNAILLRQDLSIDVSNMDAVTLNNALYTRDDICVKFGEGLKATVSIDGQAAINYESGYMYYGDGEYAFVIRDIAGNRVFYTINHKSMNHYDLIDSSTDENIFFGGVINNANVTFMPSDGSRLKYVFLNGELLSEYATNTFTQTGHWEIIIEDGLGNQSYEEFYILNNSLAEFTYTAPLDYEVTEVWRIKPDGNREMLNYRGTNITLKDNGDYVVVVTSRKTISSFNFTVTINNTPPSATLNGVEDNGVTANDVTVSGLKVGDVVRVYKDGVLISTTSITLSNDSPTINEGGKYRVTVTNIQGVTIEYNFVRKAITNAAGSIFLMVTAGLLVAGISFGLVYHTKLKTDD